ncbi:hypothetical protein M409DRAFT_52676 [Zasmidium cellare ATCC 36951]|uniref:AB hydrolase-1 domain-containing protein n=1 Tax=Zasmidium cellare ATCC 36951 TaxID=1080233 RepID=A0A6A6CQR8_ZASCE|nr:uncharacterized protein M409DRAFT_52676 [Zasmidium cellare ATCC 36951]KAF2169435.1 hypothetical protein M409DRAFT_52676 [Zasmidium cellare ATCC 36951]
MLLHATTASGAQWLTQTTAGNLFQSGQAIDASKYFIVIPDSIGHGQSSKPSDGLQSGYPSYVFDDMIEAQYQLLTENLGVDHLRLVWATTHPTFMDNCCAVACAPAEIGGRNRAFRKAAMESITSDPGYNGGKYTTQPRGFALGLPDRSLDGPDRESSDVITNSYVQNELARQDANDFVYAFAASADYDPRPKLGDIEASFMAINFEDDQTNPPQLKILEREIQKVKKGSFVIVPASEKTYGHSNQGHAEFWEQYKLNLQTVSINLKGHVTFPDLPLDIWPRYLRQIIQTPPTFWQINLPPGSSKTLDAATTAQTTDSRFLRHEAPDSEPRTPDAALPPFGI